MKEVKSYGIVVKIMIYNGTHVDEVVYYRARMDINFALRWKWYFEYLAALIKVNNPRRKVEFLFGPQDLKTGDLYIEEKRKSLLKAKKTQIKKLCLPVVDDDLFGFKSQQAEEKKDMIQKEIDSLERGEFNYWYPVEYINRVKKWINRL